MRADAAENISEWIRRTGQKIGFLILRDPDGLNVAAALRMNRTGGAAGNILVEILLVRDRDGIRHGFSVCAGCIERVSKMAWRIWTPIPQGLKPIVS
jgi:hypothetical protein